MICLIHGGERAKSMGSTVQVLSRLEMYSLLQTPVLGPMPKVLANTICLESQEGWSPASLAILRATSQRTLRYTVTIWLNSGGSNYSAACTALLNAFDHVHPKIRQLFIIKTLCLPPLDDANLKPAA